MGTNPDPVNVVSGAAANGPIRTTYRHCPDLSLLLELERWMQWVGAKQAVLFFGESLHVLGEFGVELAKCRG